MQHITLENIDIRMHGGRKNLYHANPPYPFRVWGHTRAPYDIYCRHVDDLTLRNVRVTWNEPENPEWGSAIRCLDIAELDIDGFVGRQAAGSGKPAITLEAVTGARICNSRAPAKTGVFLHLGENTSRVSMMNNDLSLAEKANSFAQGVNESELFLSGNRKPEKR